ncbi:hypothetical protein AAHA92_33860 [Salvia divinorum]|uniref:Uncharacterized protein n=1 Tax=Salvia divinorum TaxID=28513 RepID=A0ABD1FH61_SALDI
MVRFHVSSDSDYEPMEREKAQLRREKAQREREKAQREKEKKEKAAQRRKETKEKAEKAECMKEKRLGKRKKKTRAKKYPLLSNYLRLYFPEEARLDQYLRMIPKQDCISFEDSWDEIFQSEFFITHKLENLAYKFRRLVIKHLKP